MIYPEMKSLKFLCLAALAFPFSANAAVVSVNSYDYTPGPNPNGSYPDPSGGELTDGVTFTTVWPDTALFGPLAGWLNTDPSITFNFDSTATVSMVQVWAADSNGEAGVALPSTITVRTPDSSFSQTFNVTDPAGSGTTVRLDLTGFQVTTDSLVIESTRANQWTMFSEVRFDTVPEPSSALLLGLSGLFLLRRRR